MEAGALEPFRLKRMLGRVFNIRFTLNFASRPPANHKTTQIEMARVFLWFAKS